MKVLVIGANGYIGSRLIPVLIQEGHSVVALVRDHRRIKLPEEILRQITLIEGDLLKSETLAFPKDCKAAYFLAHSMSYSKRDFHQLEGRAAENFCTALRATEVEQILYLSALNTGERLSGHFRSRLNVEAILQRSKIPVTIFRAGIVIGSGSASFEMIYDLVEKLPVMVTPKWVKNRCQPIAIYDVLFYLSQALGLRGCYGKTFDIGGGDILSYRQMMQIMAEEQGLSRLMITVPVLTPRLSSYWLYFVTSTNYTLASTLVDSLKSEAVCQEHTIESILPHTCLTFRQAIKRALKRDEHQRLMVDWRYAQLSEELPEKPPEQKCIREVFEVAIQTSHEAVCKKIFSIGGENGWYAYNWAWKIRGFIDKIFGGVGLRRGRSDPEKLCVGDALDFWRVIDVDAEGGYLLLFAEMRLPGKGWLEFSVKEQSVIQRVFFRPKGLLGYLYWYCLYPVHHFLFRKLIEAIAS